MKRGTLITMIRSFSQIRHSGYLSPIRSFSVKKVDPVSLYEPIFCKCGKNTALLARPQIFCEETTVSEFAVISNYCKEPPVPEKPVPTFDLLNIRLIGYDFQILERYQSYVARLADSFGLEVCDAWATPCSKTKASIYKARTTIITEEFILSKYERNVQLLNVPATKLTILADFLRTNLPKGVVMNFKRHNSAEDDDKRYVPDYDLMELSKQLEITEKTISSMKIPTTKK
uniref:Ribosomal protein S10 domain-containing protein n=1 Tax=Romanomermis culicivorax TaxID=13658 RepID=A0A915HNA3_ROMCU